MLQLIARRLLVALPILFGLLSINFFLIHAAPGDPSVLYIDGLDPDKIATIKKDWGLGESLTTQYVCYLDRILLHFDFGTSLHRGQKVSEILLEAIPNTLQLTIAGFLIYLALGVTFGVVSATRQNSRLDHLIRHASLAAYSFPGFYLGILLLFLFAGGVFQILPTGGMLSVGQHNGLSFLGRFLDRMSHLILPAIALGIGSAASMARFVRAEMLETLGQDYIRAARARGLTERRVIIRHGLRNSLIPVVTLLGLSIPALLGGSVIIENVFSWPGLGRIAVRAVTDHDYPLFLGTNLMLGFMVMVGSLVSDVLQLLVDPRLRGTQYLSGDTA